MMHRHVIRAFKSSFKSGLCNKCFSTKQCPQITVNPAQTLIDQDVQTLITNCQPHHPVTLHLSVTNNLFLHYASTTHFVSNEQGLVDLSKVSPTCGSYKGPNPMGIFWTMKPQPGSSPRFWTTDVTKPLKCEFGLYEGHLNSEDVHNYSPQCTGHHLRMYMAEGVKRYTIKEGRVRGTLFLPPNPGPYPAIITLYGGINRGQIVEERSAFYASHGFASLALAFFGIDNFPKDYNKVPLELEYFEEAIDFLRGHERVRSDIGVGMSGISKGGELSLVSAAFLGEKVKAVAFMNGVPVSSGNPVHYKGRRVLKGWEFFNLNANRLKFIHEHLVDMSGLLYGVDKHPESVIPFANCSADLLFIGGEDDQCCPCFEPLEFVEKLLKESNKTNYQILTYKGLGHLIDLPHSPPTSVTNHVLFPKPTLINMGGSDIHLHSIGQQQVSKKLLEFFQEKLR